jgi:uncharacterized membrane protein YfcA
VTLLLAVVTGALGGAGSILVVPVLVYLSVSPPFRGITGSLAVAGVTSVIGVVTARHAGNVKLARGITFRLVAIGGAATRASCATAPRGHGAPSPPP